MHTLLRLCLWQALIISICCFSLPTSAEDDGIRIRGPKSTDAFPYDRYGPITSKDTLWNIALKVRPDPRLSVYQVMQALYENNPNSFKENNLNHMISGQYLKLPSIDVIRAINPDIAQQKSRSDDKAWQQKVAKVVKVTPKKIPNPEEASVNKKDLDAAKSEINTQLQTIDNTQQQRLATIQNDVLDSIDGLQSLLKENEALRDRLTSFNDQLGVMQSEVAKSKEIKVQMDDMISLQQELLSKAEAREQALLIEKQKAELEEGNLMSSSWFIALMATLPALLVLSLVAILFRRKNNKDSNEDLVPDKTEKSVDAKEKTPPTKEAVDNELTLEDELSLDDELSLEDELSLDDELSIDLSENDEDHDDLFSDDLDALDEDVIQLDDDLDDLDDLDELEDIALDNNEETIALDDDPVEGEPLEGGQLDQSDLDSLFAGLEDEVDNTEEIALDSDEIALDELDTLLSEGKTSESEETDAGADTVLNDDDDIDSLLDAAVESNDIDDKSTTDISEVSEPDDIDALLDAVSETKDSSDEPASIDVSDPDDIDALLDSINGADEPLTSTDNDSNTNVEKDAESNADIADPDDIDALLDSINSTDEPSSDNDTIASVDESIEDAESNLDIADPDDIDALSDSINGADESSSDNNTNAIDDDNTEDAKSNADIADPDDIDALLDSINGADESTADKDSNVDASLDSNIPDDQAIKAESTENENTTLINNFTDEYVQSFIDTDLSEIANDDAEESLQAENDNQSDSQNDSQNNVASHTNEDISDDFDIDALIEEVNHHPEPTNEDSLEIGDDILDTELQDTDSSSEKLGDEIADSTDLDDETLAALSGDFDESTLTNLLNDEKTDNDLVELSPDFTDSNVLADLLSDDSPIEKEGKKSAVDNTEEVAGIKELDNLDFDDLLANIEEESGQASSDEFEFNESFDIGDDFDSDIEEEFEGDNSHKENNEDDFISVDSLLSDSLLDGKPTEPYEKMKIDVGLSEFPEFSGNITDEDIDDDDNGIAAKLDLAKVYIEIGDEDNAEVILLDVVKQGDAQQQFDAQQLLDNLKD